jgi:hypothetical protein
MLDLVIHLKKKYFVSKNQVKLHYYRLLVYVQKYVYFKMRGCELMIFSDKTLKTKIYYFNL